MWEGQARAPPPTEILHHLDSNHSHLIKSPRCNKFHAWIALHHDEATGRYQ